MCILVSEFAGEGPTQDSLGWRQTEPSGKPGSGSARCDHPHRLTDRSGRHSHPSEIGELPDHRVTLGGHQLERVKLVLDLVRHLAHFLEGITHFDEGLRGLEVALRRRQASSQQDERDENGRSLSHAAGCGR